jgi:hypothetical protein
VKRAALLVSIGAALLAGQADARPPRGSGGPGGRMDGYANPSAVIGAEVAFNQLAQEKGQWTAFRATAAKDAIMFVPQRVNARSWLNNKPNPPVAVKWQPHQVWMSCDGSYAVTRGAWQRPKSVGWFTTVWQRQPKGNVYQWVLDTGDALAAPLDAPEMIDGQVADCNNRPRKPPPRDAKAPPPVPIDPANGQSDDGTLRWVADLDAKGAGSFAVSRWTGTGYEQVLALKLSPQG